MDSLFATPIAQHADVARVVLGRLQRLHASGLSSADSLSRCEQALLHHLSGVGPRPFMACQDADEAFLYWCAKLLQSKPQSCSAQASIERLTLPAGLLNWLQETPEPVAVGGLRAILWCYGKLEGAELSGYDTPLLWQLFVAAGVDIPKTLLFQSLRHPDPAVKTAAYDYATRSGQSIGTDSASSPDHRLQLALLKAQLVAGKLGAAELLAALEHESSYAALSLRATIGDSNLPALLERHLEFDAARSLQLAALTGTRAGAELLLEALANPRFSKSAEPAWQLLSGRILSLQPQLRVAGSGCRPETQVPVGNTPDVQQARRWWREYNCLFEESPNGLLLGEPLTDRVMLRGLQGYGGWLINPLLEVALLRLGWQTIGLSAEQPCYRRRAKLREMSTACLN